MERVPCLVLVAALSVGCGGAPAEHLVAVRIAVDLREPGVSDRDDTAGDWIENERTDDVWTDDVWADDVWADDVWVDDGRADDVWVDDGRADDGWATGGFVGPITTAHPRHVFAQLATVDGQRLRCRLTLHRPPRGLAGGAVGACTPPGGGAITRVVVGRDPGAPRYPRPRAPSRGLGLQ